MIDLVDLLANTATFLENRKPPNPVSPKEFNQIIAQAKADSDPQLIEDCLSFFRLRYGSPLANDKRSLVAAVVTLLMVGITQGWLKTHRTH